MVGSSDVGALVDALTPPEHGGENTDKKWKTNVSIVVGLLVLTNALHYAIVCGWLVGFGVTGFARTDSVDALKHNQTVLEANQIDFQILDVRGRQCKAIAANNAEALHFAEERLQDRLARYHELVGSPYRLPDCKEL